MRRSVEKKKDAARQDIELSWDMDKYMRINCINIYKCEYRVSNKPFIIEQRWKRMEHRIREQKHIPKFLSTKVDNGKKKMYKTKLYTDKEKQKKKNINLVR